MRFLTGVAVGGAIGYLMGTKAGREQYDRIVAMAGDLIGEETLDGIKQTLGSTIDTAAQAMRDAATE